MSCRVLILLMIGVDALGGEVTRQGPPGKDGRPLGHSYRLEGPIRPGDTERLAALFEADALDPESPVPAIAKGRGVLPLLVLELDSSGGDVREAMRLGRWLRGKWGGAAVMRGNRCAGACVLVLAGAVARETPGVVVVTRRHLDAGYLSEMHIPTGLSTLALESGREGGRTLTTEEKSGFLLQGWDLTAREERAAAQARRYGLTSSELRRRFAETQVACGTEELVNRQVVTLELDPLGAARAWGLWGAWSDCRWKAMGARP
ncbi:MAG TPA: hypothetical protein VE359_06785 [Vicinamibacteria bacterium]|nr:hypothetical protein [Vicinamibacteria bacterium]